MLSTTSICSESVSFRAVSIVKFFFLGLYHKSSIHICIVHSGNQHLKNLALPDFKAGDRAHRHGEGVTVHCVQVNKQSSVTHNTHTQPTTLSQIWGSDSCWTLRKSHLVWAKTLASNNKGYSDHPGVLKTQIIQVLTCNTNIPFHDVLLYYTTHTLMKAQRWKSLHTGLCSVNKSVSTTKTHFKLKA